MAKPTTNTYICATINGGLDWHDIKQWSEFLQENGMFEIKDTVKTIANHVFEELQKMEIITENPDTKTVLANIPSLEEIAEHICKKEAFTVESPDGFELNACWDPEKNALNQYFYAGQVCYDICYDVKEIEPENVIYIAGENYLCPEKGIPSVERFYKKPFTDLEDARAECNRIQTAIKGRNAENVQPGLVIADKTKICKTEWFIYNMQAIELLENHPELDTEDNFHIFVQAHLEKLKEQHSLPGTICGGQ